MKVVGLLSGGKDSVYNLCHCVKQGHEVVALASLRPPQGQEEIDSYMYQTVGQDGVHLIAEAMELPLYRRTIKGKAVSQESEYGNAIDGDETEDLYALLSQVLADHPDVKGVSVGAILSNYQRVRVEHICSRLNLTSLAYLWQRDQTDLLGEMQSAGMNCSVIKVAGAGLSVKHLGQNVASPGMMAVLEKLHQRFGLHPCGEGGEYETFTVDCPLFRRRIELVETEVVLLSPPEADDYSIVAYLRIKQAKLVAKDSITADWLDRVTVPPLLEEAFEELSPSSNDSPRPSTSSVVDTSSLPTTAFYQAEDLTLDILAQSRSCLKQILDNGSLSSLCHINVYLSSMSDFPLLNQAFLEIFSSQPPTRACVAVNLPQGLVRMDVLRQTGTRKVMHVQSLGYWAPANIGPYSQANLTETRLFISGQIGLIPATLTPPSPQSFEREAILSLQHVTRVQTAACEMHARQASKVEGGICWVVCEDDDWPTRKTFAYGLWKHHIGEELPLLICRATELPKGALAEWQVTTGLKPAYSEEEEDSVQQGEAVRFVFSDDAEDIRLLSVSDGQTMRLFVRSTGSTTPNNLSWIHVLDVANGLTDVPYAAILM